MALVNEALDTLVLRGAGRDVLPPLPRQFFPGWERMLKSLYEVYARQREFVVGDPVLDAAWARGLARLTEVFIDRLAENLQVAHVFPVTVTVARCQDGQAS